MKMISEARDSTGSRMEQIMGAASPFGCEMGTVLYANLEKCGEVTSGTTMKGATNFSMYSAGGWRLQKQEASHFSVKFKIPLVIHIIRSSAAGADITVATLPGSPM